MNDPVIPTGRLVNTAIPANRPRVVTPGHVKRLTQSDIERHTAVKAIPPTSATRTENPRRVGNPVHDTAMDLTSTARLTPGSLPCVGDQLGKYRLTALIGSGSSCVVYRGEHTRLPLTVAVKVLCLEGREAGLLDHLCEEAALLAGLNHPNIVRLWDFDDEGDHPYLVTELVEGRTLEQLIDQSKFLLPDWAMFLMSQVVAGLDAAANVGIVHRDIKPANILLAKDGKAKLVDLGLAVIAGGSRGVNGTGLTGTAAYLAPEQAMNPNAVDFRADMYSLGASFYHALTGRMPFSGRSRMEVIFKHLQEPVVPPHLAQPHVPVAASNLIVRLMSKKPEDRFASYAALADAVESVLNG